MKILQETIDDLKNNPKACELIGGETSKDGTFSIPSSNPSKQLSEFMKYIYDNDLTDKNYLENNKKIGIVTSIEETADGTQLYFEDGNSFWIEKII